MKRIFFLLAFVISVILFNSCYNDNLTDLAKRGEVTTIDSTGQVVTTPVNTCDTTGVMSYANHVVPILKANCSITSCHSAVSYSGYNLSTYAGVRSVALSGKLVNSITWTGGASRMPENASKISSCNILKIQKWVAAGALNN